MGWNHNSLHQIAERYREGGWPGALYDQPQPGAPPKVPVGQKQQIIARVCGAPPPGPARWTVRLIAEEVPKRGLGPPLGRDTIRLLLRRHKLKPWREKNVVYPADR